MIQLINQVRDRIYHNHYFKALTRKEHNWNAVTLAGTRPRLERYYRFAANLAAFGIEGGERKPSGPW
jgi:hypothetical protein